MKYRIPILRSLTVFLFFLVTAGLVSFLIGNHLYFFLFGAIGLVAGITEYSIAVNPDKAQIIRKIVILSLGVTLFSLAVIIGINFQFSQVCFDIYTGIITGSLIQLVIARILLPVIYGNVFCSRACWDGAVFDVADLNKPSTSNSRSKLLAWVFMALIILITFIISLNGIPKTGTNNIRNIFIMENAGIIFFGLVISCFAGKRFYCRNLCPFITISGLISKYSLFKITPHKENKCVRCEKCNENCPMGINVMDYVKKGNRINHPNCILCEKCVSVCKTACLSMDIKSKADIPGRL